MLQGYLAAMVLNGTWNKKTAHWRRFFWQIQRGESLIKTAASAKVTVKLVKGRAAY